MKCGLKLKEMIEERLKAARNVKSLDVAREKRRLQEALKEAQVKIDNILLMRGQATASPDSMKWIMETFENLSRERAALAGRLKKLEELPELQEVILEAKELMKERLLEFKKGFAKAKGAMKKRLIRRLLKQVVVTEQGILVFMYLADGFEVPNHQLQLVKELDPKKGKNEPFYLTRKASNGDSNLLVYRSDIRKIGDAGTTRTCDLLLRRQLLYPAELQHQG